MNHFCIIFIFFLHISADNEGSHQAALTKTGQTAYPCRIDEIPKQDMMNSDIGDYPIRDSTQYNTVLMNAFAAYAMSVKIQYPRYLPIHMRQCLDFCFEHSLQPLIPALNRLQPAYKGHSAYEMFPPDLMHTFVGILQSWTSMVVTIIAKVGNEYRLYDRNIAILEDMLGRFPYKQAMPFPLKHFNRGLAVYIPNLDSNLDEKTTGYGEMKLIDYKDVPTLMLQIIICKIIQNLF